MLPGEMIRPEILEVLWHQFSKRSWAQAMVGWHHLLDGHEFEEAPGVGDGPGGLACCSPRGSKESDMTEQLN